MARAKIRGARSRKQAVQQELPLPPGRGGARKGAGRKPKGDRAGVPHLRRERLSGREPVHVTVRLVDEIRTLRAQRPFFVLVEAFAAAADRFGMRLTHWSIQGRHLHLITEAQSEEALAHGMQGLGVRIAKGLNKLFGRKGRVFADRYHAHVLRTPAEVRHAVNYVLGNSRKHARERGEEVESDWVDPYSAGLDEHGVMQPWGSPPIANGRPAVAAPRTWLLRVGWRRRAGAG